MNDDERADLQRAQHLLRSLFLGGGRMEPSSIVLRNTITDAITLLQRNVTFADPPPAYQCGSACSDAACSGRCPFWSPEP